MAIELKYPHFEKLEGQPAHLERVPRVRIAQIAMDYLEHGWSVDEMCRQHPYLSLPEAHAAMAYYFDHQEEIDRDRRGDRSARGRQETIRSIADLSSSPISGPDLMGVGLYLDVHVPRAIAEQLRHRGVDVLAAIEDGSDQLSDEELLDPAATLDRVLFTQDIRFKALAEDRQRQGHPFSGLLFGHQRGATIGKYVGDLELVAGATDLADWVGVIEHLPF